MSATRPLGEPDLAIDERETVRILEGFLRTEMERTGRKRLVAGLSGGIDSTLTAAIAVDALGPENVHCVLMPSRFSSDHSLSDAISS